MGSVKPIYYWRYTLKSRTALNAVSGRTEHEGALIKIGEGHGCIHPWPELGDEPLEKQLKILSEGGETLLLRGTKQCVETDESFRMGGVHIFKRPFPKSHWLVRGGDDPGFAASEGFGIAKIKGTRDFESVRKLITQWSGEGMKIRLDFNEVLEPGQFLDFWNSLSGELKDTICAVEDPEAWTDEGWMKLRVERVPITLDREASKRLQARDTVVVKPAKPDYLLNHDTRFFVTSYMDHAIGQMWAAAVAAGFHEAHGRGRFLTCGLLTHRCFEDDEFFERIRCDGPHLLPVEGTGLGFDDLLEKLPWKRLI